MGKYEIDKDGNLPLTGPKHEGVDPLTTGQKSFGEDVKAESEKARAEKSKVNVNEKAQHRKGKKTTKK